MNQNSLKTEMIRPTWDDIFLVEALLWSRKSHDIQTQCGCVIAKDRTLISSGYNGFISDIDDSVLPNTRPDKYDFMVHAEINAIINCARLGKSTVGSTIYVTGPPCNMCLQYIWQAGISRIVYSNFSDVFMMKNTHTEETRNKILDLMNPANDYPRIRITYKPASTINVDILTKSLEVFENATRE